MFQITGTVAGMPVNLEIHVDPEIASDLQVQVTEAVIEKLPQIADRLLDSYLAMLHHPNIMPKCEQLANEITTLIQQAKQHE